MGPIASQEAIKMIGTNGGGFLNANSAHPFENPSAWSNLLQMLAIFLIPAGLCLAFGQMVGDKRQGWALLSAMTLAEGRSKAQAASLRGLKKRGTAKKLQEPKHGSSWIPIETDELRIGAVLLVEAGDVMPCDGEVIDGVASVDESAITGESAPVIREAGGDFSSVTGGTRVPSDWIVVRWTVNPGEAFMDRMISMVEGAKRERSATGRRGATVFAGR